MMLWLDGRLRAADKAAILPSDRGFLLADGLFETIRVTAGVIAHFPRHLARLRGGAGVLALPLPWSDDALAGAAAAVVAANQNVGSLRLTVTRGAGPRGVLPPAAATPTLLITAAPIVSPPAPALLVIARGTCRNEMSPLARVKALGYGDGILARQEAARAGMDDALLLNTRGTIAEATAATLFLRRDGRWLTPPVADGALPGIARGLLLEAGFAEEGSVTESDLGGAESAFLTNSLGLRVVAKIEDRALALREADLAQARSIIS
jgi:branched-chain amino acid aminotransferase